MIKEIIISPYITEKSMRLVSQNKYTFIVFVNSKKPQIIQEIQKLYNVHPTGVQVQNFKGKHITYKHRFKGKQKDYKKAIVALPKKEKIKDFIIKEK